MIALVQVGHPLSPALTPELLIPVLLSPATAGFPSPAEDHQEGQLDLTRHLVRRPAATFFLRADGDSMAPGIEPNDLLVVDRSRKPAEGDVVIALADGGFVVKRWQPPHLTADNPRYRPIILLDSDIEIWGVVTAIVRELIRQ